MKKSDMILHYLLVESTNSITEKEFSNLTEEVKMEGLKDIASAVLKNIQSQIPSSQMLPIDRSKGDIKQFKELGALNNALTNLEALVDRASNVSPVLLDSISCIAKCIFYLNQFSPQFKDAYRNKKTLLILKYQSLILSLIAATSYIISAVVDFSGESVSLNINPQIEEINPIKTLKKFINSVESGEFRIILRDLQVMRESFNENYPNGKVINEDLISSLNSLAPENMVDKIVNGLKNIYNNLDQGGKLTNILYKAAGVVALILSLRETFYTLGKMKVSISDMLSGIKEFSGISQLTSGVVNKLNKFSSKCVADSEFASDLTNREIEGENKAITTISNNYQKSPLTFTSSVEEPKEVKGNDNFDIFNF